MGSIVYLTLCYLLKIYRSLPKVVLDESVKCVEQELASLDQEFRIDRPPKIITIQGHQEVASTEAEAEFAD